MSFEVSRFLSADDVRCINPRESEVLLSSSEFPRSDEEKLGMVDEILISLHRLLSSSFFAWNLLTFTVLCY